jgi:hypothetical protein
MVTKHFDFGFSLVSPLALPLLIWVILIMARGKTSALIAPLLNLLVYPLSDFDGFWAIASLALVLCGLLLVREIARAGYETAVNMIVLLTSSLRRFTFTYERI